MSWENDGTEVDWSGYEDYPYEEDEGYERYARWGSYGDCE